MVIKIVGIAPRGSYIVRLADETRLTVRPNDLTSYAAVQRLAALEGVVFSVKAVDEVGGKMARSNWLSIVAEAVAAFKGNGKA